MALKRTRRGITSPSCAKAGIDRREAFARYYLIHQNASRAYREAGYKDGPGTRQSAHRLLTSAYIQSRIAEGREALVAALDVKLDDLVRRYRDIAFCDIADIVGCHVGACRYCHGNAHDYQWRTPREYEDALGGTAKGARRNQKMSEDKLTPDGGFGYNADLPPHPECPMCDGFGIPEIRFKDTRLLTAAQRAVLSSIDVTASGVRYRFHDRMDALKQLAKRLGFYNACDDSNVNAVARLIWGLQSRGKIERMPMFRDGQSE
jgi:phage terminase small subunit